MASIAQKFCNLMSRKRDNCIKEYQDLLDEAYPEYINNYSRKVLEKLEREFSKDHIDLKMDFYNLDCQYKLLVLMLEKEFYLPFFDLLVAFEDLTWLEERLNEFGFNLQEKKVMLKTYLKHVIQFYTPENVRHYNLAIAARKNARKLYSEGSSSIDDTILLLQNSNITVPTEAYIEKQKVCEELRKIVTISGIDAIFEKVEFLKTFGLSDELLQSIKSEKKSVLVVEKLVPANIKARIQTEKEDLSIFEEQMKKYMINDTFIGTIEGEDLKEFLELAKKLYTSEKVNLLKEKVVLNNKKIKNEKRMKIKNQIIHEDNREYYDYISSIDLNDAFYLPYASFIQSTISSIESFIEDLIENYSKDLVELYLEETNILLNNLRVCIPSSRNK